MTVPLPKDKDKKTMPQTEPENAPVTTTQPDALLDKEQDCCNRATD